MQQQRKTAALNNVHHEISDQPGNFLFWLSSGLLAFAKLLDSVTLGSETTDARGLLLEVCTKKKRDAIRHQ